MVGDLRDAYNTHFDAIYRYFFSRVLNQSVAEDLTSDTFFQLADALSAQTKIDDMRRYLFGIARIVFTKFLQEKYAHNETNFEFDFSRVPGAVTDTIDDDDEPLEDLLIRLLPLIPEKQRIVLEMRLVQKLSLQEIADELGKDMNYVKTTQKRALKSIKEVVAKRFGEGQGA